MTKLHSVIQWVGHGEVLQLDQVRFGDRCFVACLAQQLREGLGLARGRLFALNGK